MPTIRETTSSALVTPCTLVVGAGEQGGVDRGQGEPEARGRSSPARPRRSGRAATRTPSRPSARSRPPRAACRRRRPTPALTRRVSRPPTSAPTGSATRNSTSTSAALICEPSAMVIRAKIGMSTSAAIRAAPTKKLTSTAPHAGRCANAPCGTSGARDRRLCRREEDGRRRRPGRGTTGPAGENTCTSGSAVAKARMMPPSATESSPAPTRSASRTERHQSRRSTSGRGGEQQAGERGARASTIVTTPDLGEPDRPAVAERHERAAQGDRA